MQYLSFVACLFCWFTITQPTFNLSQEDLDELSQWCQAWRMQLNVQKCFYLHYVPQNRSRVQFPQYHINNTMLERREKASDLGVIVQDNLKFHEQVAKACQKASTQINVIKRNFLSRNPKFLETMYKTFIRPHIEYCIQVWNPVYVGDIEKLEKVQKRFTKLLPQSWTMSQEERNQMLNITSHESRRLRGDLIYIYKMYDSDLFSHCSESRTRGHSKKLKVNFACNNLRKHSFAVRSVDSWNSLPETVVTAPSVNSFKARIDKYFNDSLVT